MATAAKRITEKINTNGHGSLHTQREPLSPVATRVRNAIEKNPRLRIEMIASISKLLREHGVKVDDEFLLYTTIALVSEVGAGDTPEMLG